MFSFIFITSIGSGIPSALLHDAAATAKGVVNMLPLMRRVAFEPDSNTARFMLLSLAFACSCGGMGPFIGGDRCMVSAVFLVASLIITGVLKCKNIYVYLHWCIALFFLGGISPGLAMGYSGAADYFTSLLFSPVRGGELQFLLIGLGIFGALVTTEMVNIASAAPNLLIVIPMIHPEGDKPAGMTFWPWASCNFSN